MYDKNSVYDNLPIHRLEGIPKISRDYSIVNGQVKAFTIPTGRKFTNKTIPVGISCFIPVDVQGNHGSVLGVESCFQLLSDLPANWSLVFTHTMKLQSATGGSCTSAYHFNLFPTASFSEDIFLQVVKTDIVTRIPEWGLCTNFEAGGLAKILLADSDLDGFDDTRVRTLTYYAAVWYADDIADSVDKCHLSDLYFWLVDQKPSMALVSKDVRCRSVIYYLNNFGAEHGDFMGAADLQDVKLELEKCAAELELQEFTNQFASLLDNKGNHCH